MKPFHIIVAVDQNRGIGLKGQLPWSLPPDLKHFRAVTCSVTDPQTQNAVIMGRKTWESIPAEFRPLPRRMNIVLTRNNHYALPDGVLRCSNLEDALTAADRHDCERVFVIGGEQIFRDALKSEHCQSLYVTHIEKSFHCDTFFPATPAFKTVEKSKQFLYETLPYYFAHYCRK